MSASDALALLDVLVAARVAFWVDGGWGIDALIGRQTREHEDLDVAVPADELERLRGALAPLGFTHASHIAPGLPTRLVLRDEGGRQIDVHPLRFDVAGNGQLELPDGSLTLYQARDLRERGRIAGRVVPCLSASLQYRHHLGYEPGPSDRHDMRLLVERFSFARPDAYRE